MSTTSDNKEVFSDEDYFKKEEEEESDVNYLKYNLTRENLYTQIFNKYKFNKIMKEDDFNKSDDIQSEDEKIIEEKEQIDEIKLKMAMVFLNKFDISEEDKKNISCFYDIKTRNIIADRVVIQNCSVANKKLIEGDKNYLFVMKKENDAINNTTNNINISPNNKESNPSNINNVINNINNNYNNSQNDVNNDNNQNNSINNNNNINNDTISTKSNSNKKTREIFRFIYDNKIYMLIKYKKSDKIEDELIERDNLAQNKEIKALNEKEFQRLFIEQKNEKSEGGKKSGKSESENSNNTIKTFSMKTDNSEKEVLGKKFYFKSNNNNLIKRFIFKSYSKEVDGFFTKHKPLNLGKFEEINKLTEKISEYDIENDIWAHIIYKNFKGNLIKENEPLIVEVKKSFKLYDLLIQIKQLSKFGNNLYYKNGQKCNSFPKYIIGFICSDKNDYIKEFNLDKLKEEYDKNESLLEHELRVIKENNANVVIGLIENEKIKGYDLSKGDYFINPEKAIYRIDLNFLCETIFPNENKTKEIEEILGKYKGKYESLRKEKNISMSEHKRITQSLENKYNILNNNYSELVSKISGYESRIKELEEENEKMKKMKNQRENKKENDENSEDKINKNNNLENKNG